MVDSVGDKMNHSHEAVHGNKIFNMENEPVEAILTQCEEEESSYPSNNEFFYK